MVGKEWNAQRLADLVARWQGHGVLVVGDALLDEWRFAESDRLCREAPAPVLTLRRRQTSAGGAANTAVNLAALGARVALVAPVGADVAADELRDCLDTAGVRDRTVTQTTWSTPVKRRLLAADQIVVREDEGSGGPLTAAGVRRLRDALTAAADELQAASGTRPALVICDYGLGALPEPVRAWLIAYRKLFATVALDAHDLTEWPELAPTVVTPSFAEAARLLDVPASALDEPADVPGPAEDPALTQPSDAALGPIENSEPARAPGVVAPGPDRAAIAQARLAELRERTEAQVVAVTLDVEGTVVAGADGGRHRSHATPVPASQAVGAGDAYLAAMTLAIAAGGDVPGATQLAQLAATVTVAGPGTCVCDRAALLSALGPPPAAADAPHAAAGTARSSVTGSPEGQLPPVIGSGDAHGSDDARGSGDGGGPLASVVDAEALATLMTRRRQQGHTVVFTNGCFDVLHRGHVRYLEQARGLGDLLVVAVNSDDSVRRLKGGDRPINPVEDRTAVLAGLASVDYVVVFDEDSPGRLIEVVRPDVYVKGGDYPPEMVPEAPLVRRLGGQVRTLGYVPDRSTSAIIDRIRAKAVARVSSAADRGGPGPFLTERPS